MEQWTVSDWEGSTSRLYISACLFILYAKYIMRDARPDKARAGIKIVRRDVNGLGCADDTILVAESEGKLESLLMEMKEESERAGLKLNIQKMRIMASGPITSYQMDGETMETVTDFIFLGSIVTSYGDCSHEIRGCLLFGGK